MATLDSSLPVQPLGTAVAQHLPAGGTIEERLARLELPQFKENFRVLSEVIGDETEIQAALEAELVKNPGIAKLPGPHKRFGLLTAFKLVLEASQHGDELWLHKEWTKEFGGSTRNYAVPNLTGGWGTSVRPTFWVVVNNPEDHARLARDHVRKAPVYGLASYGSHFLAEVDNSEWQRRRFGAIHTVATFAVKSYCPIMNDWSRRLVARLAEGREATMMYGASAPLPAFNIHELLADTAFKIAAKALFNASDDVLESWSRKVRWALQRTRTTNEDAKRIQKEWTDLLESSTEAESGPMTEALRELSTDFPSATDTNQKAGRVKDKALRDDLLIISLAMHDTTASTMTSCMMELARRPTLQDQVAAECAAVIADCGEAGLTYDDLHKMPLMTKCIHETLRLWNAVSYGSMRQFESDESIKCEEGSITVNEGTNFYIQNFVNHRSTELWGDDAEEWRPERWKSFADEGSFNFETGADVVFSGRNPQSLRFHPFTRAPRQCFGMNFAQAEMRIVLPILLSKFRFRLAEPTVSQINAKGPDSLMFQFTGIIKPRDGLWLHAEPRHAAKL